MSVPTIQLQGTALHGYEPRLLSVEQAAALPTTVCLGRARPLARPLCPSLGAFWDESKLRAGVLPESTNWREKAAPALARMYLNDQLGICVFACAGHMLGVWSGNDSDHAPAGVVQATDQEMYQQYQTVCGPGDNGCIMSRVLDYMRTQGLLAGGQRYKIDGYVAVDWRNQQLARTAIYAFGGLDVGVNLPQAWTQSNVWDVTNSPIVGGHCIGVVDFNADGVLVSSWGRVYLMTWRAFLSSIWTEECYAVLSPLWYGNDKLSPCGIDATGLSRMLDQIGHGQLPPLPDPTPPAPPVPPVPPLPPVPPPGPSPLPSNWLAFLGCVLGHMLSGEHLQQALVECQRQQMMQQTPCNCR